MGSASFSSPNLAQNKPTNQRSESQYSQKKKKSFFPLLFPPKGASRTFSARLVSYFSRSVRSSTAGRSFIVFLLWFYCIFVVFLSYFRSNRFISRLFKGFSKEMEPSSRQVSSSPGISPTRRRFLFFSSAELLNSPPNLPFPTPPVAFAELIF